MSGNNLAVKITADIADMQVKFAVAKAEVAGLNSEMNKLAKASANGSIDSAGQARLQQLAGDLLQARSAASGYATELEKAGFAVNAFSSRMESGHGSIATATREFRALFDELTSGRTRQTPGTLAIIATRVFGLGPAALGAIAGVGALAGGLAYLAYRAISASEAIDQIKIGADFAGNAEISRQQIEQFSDEMAKAANISSSEARAIAASFTSMHDVSAVQVHALSAVVSDFATVTGQEAPKAADELAKSFNAKTSAAEFARSLGGVTQAQIDTAEAADKSGNANQVFGAKLNALTAALARTRPAIEQHNSSMFASLKNYMAYTGAIQAGMTPEEIQTDLITAQNKQREKQISLLKQLAQQNLSTPQTPEQTLKVGVSAAEKENPISQQVDQAKAKIAEMTAALAIAQQRGDQIDVAKLNAGLEKARENLSTLQFGPIVERMREQMQEVAAAWDGTQIGMLQRQRQVVQQSLAQTRAGSAQYLQIRSEEARIDVELKKARLDAEKEVTQAAKQGLEDRVALIRDQLSASDQYLTQEARDEEELYSGWTETYTHITNMHASMLKQQAADAARNAKDEASAWKGVVGEIENSEGSMVSNILAKRKSLAQSLVQLGGDLVTREIANDVRALTTKALLQDQEKALEQGGLLFHLTLQKQKSIATKASEQAQTAAVEIGNQLRVTSTETAASGSRAASAAVGGKTVLADAAKAFSGTYASVAQIPYVGWILAPAAATAAYAAVAAYEGLASLDVGTNYVPRDMIAQIHEGEAVVPKRYNPDAGGSGFAFAGAGGGYSEEHNYHGGVNIRALDTQDFARAARRNGASLVQAAARAFRRGAR